MISPLYHTQLYDQALQTIYIPPKKLSTKIPTFDHIVSIQIPMKRSLVALFFLSLLITACSKYGSVTLQYPTAPRAFLPQDIHTLAMVNRSLTQKNDGSVVESILSGEVAGSDKRASDEALKGVFDRINGWHEIRVVIPSQTRLYGTGTRQTPELLDWKMVQQICDSTGADALLVLETFDSNSDLLATAINEGVNTLVTGNAPAPPRRIRVNVYCYWRLYDPKSRTIIDQYQSTSYMVFDAGPALVPVPPPEALPQTAYYAGAEYIQRFLPTYYNVKRSLYKKGKSQDKHQFLAAFRRAEVADWQGAMDIWKKLADSSNRDNAGRACLNVAVSYEVLGNINEALLWAKRAYVDYGNKLARDYQQHLNYRLSVEY